MTSGADTDELDGFAIKREAETAAQLLRRVGEIVVLGFDGRAALATDQELIGMLVFWHGTADESLRALDAMYKTMLDEEFEATINTRRGS
jgi:hypothetical protein